MAELVLYGVAVSAFVAKVRIVLDHKGLEFEELPPPGGYGSLEYRKIVPAGSVPGMTVDGTPLHDSNAIIEFLDHLVPTPPLRPAEPLELAHMRALLGFHDTRIEAAARGLFPIIKGGGDATGGVEAINQALSRLDDLLAATLKGPFLFGNAPSLADMAYPCTFQMAEMMARELGAPLIIPPRIDRWRKAVSEIDAVTRSLTIAGEAMEAWMQGFRGART